MNRITAFIGKGGTGKTTLTALFLKYVLSKNITPVLAIDADPNSCLGELLGLEIENTIGNIKEELLEMKPGSSSISKHDYCEFALNNALIENKGFDLLTMGRSEGPGCYCYVNNVVKTMLENLQKNYKLIIVDCEAGLEHLSRRTLGNIETAVIVSDMSRKGILTGIRQVEMMDKLKIKTKNNFLVINNVIHNDQIDKFKDLINFNKDSNLKFAGIVPHYPDILEFELNRQSFLDFKKVPQTLKSLLI